ncbi:hypothetical protein BCV69DRAFT_300948 [Microstroma glucosiphilum]|uniref:Uncharacterized protein n=1 Tax=Pseudomicrostroma glucosiphilum TaxID=1684307 RepID=A0A316U054_9BASI|nr:hypothetical protein BCV69DRAFT_300948 [Pseudomicrostroma glucosiphilum]PWN18792.1 hypothetical protein BCV69DRAFT_300948 [Pseudomicrostroma glucosiphilum]
MPPSPFPRPSTSQLRSSAPEYKRLLAVRAKQGGPPKERTNLVELDEQLWGRGESSISGRLGSAEHGESAELSLEDLKKCMTWKLARGKFRPTLLPLLSSNSPDLVANTTRQAFSQYAATPAGALASLKTLCVLKGIGPATASLLLSLYSPETEAFMSDEALLCLDCKVGYTEKDWKGFREKVTKAVQEGKWESAKELEKGCWAWAMRVQGGEETSGELREAKQDLPKTSLIQKSQKSTSSKVSQNAEPEKGRGKRTSLQKASESEESMTTKTQTVDSAVDKAKRRRTKA